MNNDIASHSEVFPSAATNFDKSRIDRPLIRNSVLTYKTLTARKNIDREIAFIQRKITALQFVPNNKKSQLSKSAKKRLRKKRQADAKLLRSAIKPCATEDSVVALVGIENVSATDNNVKESVLSVNTSQCRKINKSHKSLSVSNIQKKQTILPQKINAKKLASNGEYTKTAKKRKKTSKKYSKGNLTQFSRSKTAKGAFIKTQDLKIPNNSNNKPLHERPLSLYSFVVKGSLSALPTEDILWLLELQNSFVTNEWIVKQRKEIGEDNVMILVAIDPVTEYLLNDKSFQVLLHKTTVTFKAEHNYFITESTSSYAENKELISISTKSTMPAAPQKSANDKRMSKIKVNSTCELAEKSFNWLGEWQDFTTVLNKVN